MALGQVFIGQVTKINKIYINMPRLVSIGKVFWVQYQNNLKIQGWWQNKFKLTKISFKKGYKIGEIGQILKFLVIYNFTNFYIGF